MVLWKSRWSSVRFVNTPTRKAIWSARCRTSAWDETSMMTCVQPAAFISANSFCSSKDSGVVRSVCRTSSPIMFWMVPMRPTFAPRVFSSTCLSRYVLVVLPFVPVMPIMHMLSDGWPNQFAPSAASAARASGTST